MKKEYKKPTTDLYEVEAEYILAASVSLSKSEEQADPDLPVCAKEHYSVWE